LSVKTPRGIFRLYYVSRIIFLHHKLKKLTTTLILGLLFGCAVGFIGGYAGIGGAPFLVAFLVIALGFNQFTAQGTVLAVMLGPMSLLGVIKMWDRIQLMIPYVLIGVVTYATCSYLGARAAYAVDETTLRMIFGIVLVGLGLFELLYRPQGISSHVEMNAQGLTVGEDALLPSNFLSLSIVGIGVGLAGGFLGIGAGVLMVPIFVNLFRIHKDDARAMSLAILLPPVSLGAVIQYQSQGAIDWMLAGGIFLAYFSTNYFGAQWGRKHSNRQFKRYFGLIMVALGGIYVLI